MQKNLIFITQLISLVVMWIFVIGIAIWILNLISISVELQDAPGVTIGISIIAIPVFFTIASILTYVFVGFRKDNKSDSKTSLDE
jgi:hypothetical protein